MSEENGLDAQARAKLATRACFQLALLNARMVLHTPNCPFPFYTDMTTGEFVQFNKFLGMVHDSKITDLSALEPYFRIYK